MPGPGTGPRPGGWETLLYGMEDPGFVSYTFCKFGSWAAEREVWVYRMAVVRLLLLVARSKRVPSWHLKFPTSSWAEKRGSTITVEGALYWHLLQTARQNVCSQNTFSTQRKLHYKPVIYMGMCCGAVARCASYDAHLATAPQHIPTQHDMLPQHLVCK